mmetsp:Transcript_19023/g.52378  ORF Transcript_19023/g.52378 Transcript_19023/m.52378 type:complete len:223 (+) Transcript_19023:973-1641(+)
MEATCPAVAVGSASRAADTAGGGASQRAWACFGLDRRPHKVRSHSAGGCHAACRVGRDAWIRKGSGGHRRGGQRQPHRRRGAVVAHHGLVRLPAPGRGAGEAGAARRVAGALARAVRGGVRERRLRLGCAARKGHQRLAALVASSLWGLNVHFGVVPFGVKSNTRRGECKRSKGGAGFIIMAAPTNPSMIPRLRSTSSVGLIYPQRASSAVCCPPSSDISGT